MNNEQLVVWLKSQYLDARELEDGTIAVLNDLMYTRAIMLEVTEDGFGTRYCFENRQYAKQLFDNLKTCDDHIEGYVATRNNK